MRHALPFRAYALIMFQSTHPARGATDRFNAGDTAALQFQSTHPARGATDAMYEVLTAPVFQSTHPARGATSALIKDGQNAGISIHAPREGCDQKVLTVLRVAVEISIHAPREGCDATGLTQANIAERFQSTHPARGATGDHRDGRRAGAISIHAPREGCDRMGAHTQSDGRYFNPRTPRGVRPASAL